MGKFSLLILPIYLALAKCQTVDIGTPLQVVQSELRLPEPLTWHTSEFDGKEFIYNFGGWSNTNTPYTNISRFSPFSNDGVAEHASDLTVGSLLGTVVLDKNAGVFYHFGGGMGGGDDSDLVTKYNQTSGEVAVVAQLPETLFSHSTALHDSKAYSTEGTPTLYGYMAFDVNSYTVSTVPFRSDCSFMFTAGPMVSYNGLLYVFGQCWVFDSSIDWAYVKWDPETGDYTYINVMPLAEGSFEAMKMVGEAPYYYILGSTRGENGSVKGLWEINFETESLKMYPLLDFPGDWTTSYTDMGVAYVSEQRRIYYIGGCFGCTSGGPNVKQDGIWYIQLPEIFSCEGKEDGFYPLPDDCSRYVNCSEGNPTFYDCPPGMYYDPVTTTCRPADEVECPNRKAV